MLTDIFLEKSVLAGIIKHGASVYHDVNNIVTINSFSVEFNQVLYKIVEDVFKKDENISSIDLPTIISSSKGLGLHHLVQDQNNIQQLRAIINFPINKDTVKKLSAKLRKLEIGRIYYKAHDECKEKLEKLTGEELLDEIIGISENPILDLSSLLVRGNAEVENITSGIDEYISDIIANPNQQIGVSTGYNEWDRSIGGGLRPKTISLIGARSKVGKTFHADSVGLHVAGNLGHNILNLDTEMAKEDHWHRMLANISGVPIYDIETGKFAQNAKDKADVLKAKEWLKTIPYDYISIAGQPFEETLSLMRRWITKVTQKSNKTPVIIYDYLKLMNTEILKSMAEFQALGFLMSNLHNFMHKYNCACLAYVQLNRDGIDKEDSSVISQSDRLLWLCSNFSILKKKSIEELAEERGTQNGNRKLVTMDCRHGPGLDDGDYINVHFKGEIGRMQEGKRRNQIHTQSNNAATFDVTGLEEDMSFGELE